MRTTNIIRGILVVLAMFLVSYQTDARLPIFARLNVGILGDISTKSGDIDIQVGARWKGLEFGVDFDYYSSLLYSSNDNYHTAHPLYPEPNAIAQYGKEGLKLQQSYSLGGYVSYDIFYLILEQSRHHMRPFVTLGIQERCPLRVYSMAYNGDWGKSIKYKTDQGFEYRTLTEVSCNLGIRYEFDINRNWAVGISYMYEFGDNVSILGFSGACTF